MNRSENENKALEKATSSPKTAELVSTLTMTSANASATIKTVAKANVQPGKWKASAPKEKKKGVKQEKLREETPEVVAIESDVESDAELVIDKQLESPIEQRVGTGSAMQSTSANTGASPMGADARTPM